MKITKWIPLLGVIALFQASADQTIELVDGRHILLKDNFTWEYVPKAQPEASVNPTAVAATNLAAPAPAPVVVPVVTTVIPAKKTIAFSPGQSSSILQTEQSDYTVVLAPPKWDGDELVIPTEIYNNAIQPLIELDLKVEIYGENGQLLHSDEFPVWRSIKRMANTYLRPGQNEIGTAIKIELPKQGKYSITASISDITTRG
ncbi:DUF3157 family protein [Ferrimonas lipolytica]|uniref:DUF3157 family protein n=1 Tax=Ferrimonas lipolytica TaxID=2724191 RepID=A0A6H1UEU2_9GAMM|nr:DUF3157 family protein [Ferrimonas lipolytica]QIZ77601.1 DUF3157 family protein [Ferrimonas lipolytica]